MEAKKVDLLSFQKNLNEQFIEIFEAKKRGNVESVKSVELGLHLEAINFKFFISLKDLQNISMNNTYEESKLLASWICGFNQIRGEVFTIMDFKKTLNYLINKIDDQQYRKIGIDNRIIYLKEYSKEKIGLIIDNVQLAHTPDFTPLFRHNQDEKKRYWELNEELNFDGFVKEENMLKDEFDILKQLLDKKIDIDYSNDVEKDIFFYLLHDVYLDVLGKRPIFVLDIQNLTKVLINISPLQ